MALWTPGPLVTSISGKVGGVTFLSGKAQRVLQVSGSKLKKESIARQRCKSATKSIADLWAAADSAEKMRWNALAARLNKVDRLGTPRAWSGRMLYFKEWFLPYLTGGFGFFFTDAQPIRAGLQEIHINYYPFGFTVWMTPPADHPNGAAWVYVARAFSRTGWKKTIWHLLPVEYFVFGAGEGDITAGTRAVIGEPDDGELFAVKVVYRAFDCLTSPPLISRSVFSH